MNRSLAQQPWLTAAATRRVMDAMEAAGGADCARFVGGCVRNSLLGRPVDDIDIATVLEPAQTIAALEAARIRAIPTGVEHGTVTAVADGRPFEITTLRRDVETDGRRAVVAFTRDWAEDAARRDFTMNALYAGRDGELFDPTGEGLADVQARRVLFVGKPDQRIREDYLRILRFFRFFAWYGAPPADPAALAACAALKEAVSSLAAERITKEILKLLAAPAAEQAVRLMAETGVLAIVLGGPGDVRRLAGLVRVGEADPVLRLAALAAPDRAAAAELANRLRLSNAERDRIAAAAEPSPRRGLTDKEARREIHAHGAQAVRDRASLAWAGEGGGPGTPWPALIAFSHGWAPPALPIDGDDVVAAGLPKGPMIGRALREVEGWWIDHDFAPGRAEALKRLAAVVEALI